MTTASDPREKRRELYGMSERAFAVYVDQRRTTPESVAEVIRISVAEELRRQADAFDACGDKAHESACASSLANHVHNYLGERAAWCSAAERLRARAGEIDSDGAA